MLTAQDYPITTPYGYVKGYPLNNGFHNGIDYGCPSGTPIVVNGVTIGLSGATGYVDGPHLHVGRWVNGQVTNPGSGGFQFNNAVVTEINEDATNGKYVRVQGDGASWVYLHMSNNKLVTVGQQLQGEEMFKTHEQVDQAYLATLHRKAETVDAKEHQLGKTMDDWNHDVVASNEWLTQNDVLLRAYPAMVAKVAELQEELAQSGSDKANNLVADMQKVIDKYK